MAVPVRMCINCRERFAQSDLIRLQYDKSNGAIILFSGVSRSFYVCKKCIQDDKLCKSISKVCRLSKEESRQLLIVLKEKFVI